MDDRYLSASLVEVLKNFFIELVHENLILLLILHPRTSSKNGLCVLCVRPIPNRARVKKSKKTTLFNTAYFCKKNLRSLRPLRVLCDETSFEYFVLLAYFPLAYLTKLRVLMLLAAVFLRRSPYPAPAGTALAWDPWAFRGAAYRPS